MHIRLSQHEQLFSILIDIAVLIAISFIGFGWFFPPLGDKGFWFYTAALNIIIGSRLVTPNYTKPVDALVYSSFAFIALMLVNRWPDWDVTVRVCFVVLCVFCVLMCVTAIRAIILYGRGTEEQREKSNFLKIILGSLAGVKAIYIPTILFAMLAFHYDSNKEMMAIVIALFLTVVYSVGYAGIWWSKRLREMLKKGTKVREVAEVVAYQQPGIILLRELEKGALRKNTFVFVKDELSNPRLALILGLVGRENGLLVRAVELAVLDSNKYEGFEKVLSDRGALILDDQQAGQILQDEGSKIDIHSELGGLVAPESRTEYLFFEVVNDDSLQNGKLVGVAVQGQNVLYQIVEGVTKEEIVHHKNTYGYLRGQAQQVGIWNKDDQKFMRFDWLPSPNSPVYLEKQERFKIDKDTIGHLPDTNYRIRIGNVHDLVTHNTAILGILGVGKSMLAIELIERMIAEGIKVVCLDLTDQYATELKEFYDVEYEGGCIRMLKDACEKDKEAWANNPEEGGSLPNLKQAIYDDLSAFLANDTGHVLKIYNPAEFVPTRQNQEPKSYNSGGQWLRGAALFSVTPVEVTQIVSEALLDLLSDEMVDYARVCIVYEEAHSLAPEWNSVVADGDQKATSGTARAILQGRKFGLGCLLITQRTANVTKTILNQCNTIFAMRTFDETGKTFLSNYIGSDYASKLSSVPERHAVFFGKGSSCENPVLIRVNDRDDFISCFREHHKPPIFDKTIVVSSNGAHIEAEEEPQFDPDDDLPF